MEAKPSITKRIPTKFVGVDVQSLRTVISPMTGSDQGRIVGDDVWFVSSGVAHIVIAVHPDGGLHLQALRRGKFNASYGNRADSVLAEIPKLLAELRGELAADDLQSSVEGS